MKIVVCILGLALVALGLSWALQDRFGYFIVGIMVGLLIGILVSPPEGAEG